MRPFRSSIEETPSNYLFIIIIIIIIVLSLFFLNIVTWVHNLQFIAFPLIKFTAGEIEACCGQWSLDPIDGF